MMTAARSMHAHIVPHSQFEQLREAREILRLEAGALVEVSNRLDAGFCRAIELIGDCRGRVIVTGIGKAGLIGQKLTATFSSTGTRAHFLHPSEAVHGDLGCVDSHDVLVALSNSGETDEVCRLLPTMEQFQVPIIAITASSRSTLGQQAAAVVELGKLREACMHGLAPSTSTTAMLAVGDALALIVSRQRNFTPDQFAVFHPGGSLGRKLTSITDIMRPINDVRVAAITDTVREVFVEHALPGRRSGAVILLDDSEALAGLFTDSDLARLLERRSDQLLDGPIGDVMTADPTTIRTSASLADVVDLMADRKLSELPVVDADHRPVGMIDITDVIGWLPAEAGD